MTEGKLPAMRKKMSQCRQRHNAKRRGLRGSLEKKLARAIAWLAEGAPQRVQPDDPKKEN